MTISTFGLRISTSVGLVAVAALVVTAAQQSGPPPADPKAAPPGASLSTGLAADVKPISLAPKCTHNVTTMKIEPDVFPVSAGVVTSIDGKKWTVPGPVEEAPLATDLFNDCLGPGDNPDWEKQLQTVVVDKDGVEITGFIFADNYYELYVNGKLVARDPVGMTPFNSTVVRFRARYPMTYAIKGIDWETKHGLGMEYMPFNLGDGGFVAYFSDGNGTDGDWRAETFYIAPLDDPLCVRTTDGHDSTYCAQAVRPTCAQMNPTSCKALHFPVPENWMAPTFNDSAWPRARVWRPVEVTPYPAYWKYTDRFGNAEFIWTRNIRLDNLVLARFTAKGPRR